MEYEERVCNVDCHGERLYGILTLPAGWASATAAPPSRGVVMLVGGAQYRAGSHRQFTVLARAYAAAGIAVLRFDFRGMGDSEGETRDFEQVGDDIRCAIDALMQALPGLSGVTLWGLCDGASAALLYAAGDPRVQALALLNPWARTEAGQAQAYLKHYYLARFFSKDLWRKILRGQFAAGAALGSFADQWRRALTGNPATTSDATAANPSSLPQRLLQGYASFTGPILLVLCGNDLTAREFSDLATPGSRWHAQQHGRRTTRLELADANHTFSTRAWREQVAVKSIDWLRSSLP